jgi:hypothetical protein
MYQIFAHRSPSKTTLLHDLPPPDWFLRRYRKHDFGRKRILTRRSKRRK